MKSSPFLSVCIITKNEEKFIEGCIRSVISIANEIIIVDSFSTDTTKKIALKYPVSFYERTWNHDYSAARNFAIEKASGKWLLFLDADERIENAKELLQTLKKERSNNTGGFLCERKDIFRHKENSKISHYAVGNVRICRNLPDIRFSYKIHEQLNASLLNNGYNIKIEKQSRIIHLVEQSNDAFLDKKQKYYLKLLTRDLKKDPQEPWLSYQKAKTLWYFNKTKEAHDLFESIAKNKKNPLDIRTSSFNQMAILLGQQGEHKKAFAKLKLSRDLINEQSLAYSIAYNLYYETNEYDKAIENIKKVKTSISRCKWQHIIPGDLYSNKDMIAYKIACCYLAQNKLQQAKLHFEKGITHNPESSENFYGLSVMYAFQKKNKEALKAIQKCLKYNPNWKEALLLRTQLLSAA